MSTSRTKRWNGTLESLSSEYLKGVMERMEAYGDHVQFEVPGHGKQPIYQVLRGERKMGFDGKHLLLRLNESGNVADGLSPAFSKDDVRGAIAGKRSPRSTGATRSTASAGSSGTARQVRRAAPEPATDTVEQQKYAYYREHRDELPEGIARHADEISTLMRSGHSAEAAFQQIVEQYY